MPRKASTAAGYDQDQSFMLVEIAGDELYFQTISRTGQTVDSGMIPRVATTAGAAFRPAEQVVLALDANGSDSAGR